MTRSIEITRYSRGERIVICDNDDRLFYFRIIDCDYDYMTDRFIYLLAPLGGSLDRYFSDLKECLYKREELFFVEGITIYNSSPTQWGMGYIRHITVVEKIDGL